MPWALHANLNISNIYIGEACWQNVANFADILCLPYLSWLHHTDRNDIICVVLAQGGKASRGGIIALQYHQCFHLQTLPM